MLAWLFYSCVHISLDSLFSKILKKTFIVQKKNDNLIWICCLLFSLRFFFWKTKIQNVWLKKTHFPDPPILKIFSRQFYELVPGLVELIDVKGIGVAQFIWSWDCLT